MVTQNNIIPPFTQIHNTYTIDCYLGEGAFGRVYRVRHKYLGIQALKIFNPNIILKSREAELFNEAYILSKLTHENVVRVYEANTFVFNEVKYAYIAMEYVNGGTLADSLEKYGQLPPHLVLELQKDICRGLAEGHKLEPPIVHRDVKPHNIMLCLKGNKLIAKVSDFGLARHVDPITRITTSGGTLAFMPPEGFWDYELPASDVFSAGIIFYIMLTGVAPFPMPAGYNSTKKTEVRAAIKASRNKVPEPPSKYNKSFDKLLDEIILMSLQPNIKKRYQTAQEFLHAIEQYQLKIGEKLDREIQNALKLGEQYSTLSDAIKSLESIIVKQPADKRIQLERKYRKILNAWKKGTIM